MSDNNNKDLAGLVEETIRTLFDKGIAAADLAPLVKLHDAFKMPDAPSVAPATATISTLPVSPENAPAQPAQPAPLRGHRVLMTEMDVVVR